MIHILLVEDDKDLNQTVCRHLISKGYQVKGVLNATGKYCLGEETGDWKSDIG